LCGVPNVVLAVMASAMLMALVLPKLLWIARSHLGNRSGSGSFIANAQRQVACGRAASIAHKHPLRKTVPPAHDDLAVHIGACGLRIIVGRRHAYVIGHRVTVDDAKILEASITVAGQA
ncbi:MAG TPA: hypothetical protein VF271_00205, partial [Rhodanobacteraceae bacterium]